TGSPEGRVTRQAEIKDARAPTVPSKPRRAAVSDAPPAPRPAPRAPSKPRAPNEETRQVTNPGPPGPGADSGLLDLQTPPPPVVPSGQKQGGGDHTITDGALGNIGERTVISAPSGMSGFMMDVAGEEGVDATVVSSGPPTAEPSARADAGHGDHDDDDDHETL